MCSQKEVVLSWANKENYLHPVLKVNFGSARALSLQNIACADILIRYCYIRLDFTPLFPSHNPLLNGKFRAKSSKKFFCKGTMVIFLFCISDDSNQLYIPPPNAGATEM